MATFEDTAFGPALPRGRVTSPRRSDGGPPHPPGARVRDVSCDPERRRAAEVLPLLVEFGQPVLGQEGRPAGDEARGALLLGAPLGAEDVGDAVELALHRRDVVQMAERVLEPRELLQRALDPRVREERAQELARVAQLLEVDPELVAFLGAPLRKLAPELACLAEAP